VRSSTPIPEGPAEDFPETQPPPAVQEVIHVPTVSHGDQGFVQVSAIIHILMSSDSASCQLVIKTRIGHEAHLGICPQ
jgi:hypothetical protein